LFDLLVRKEWPAKDVARSLGMSLAKVYFTRHRFEAALGKQARQLERQLERLAKDNARKAGSWAPHMPPDLPFAIGDWLFPRGRSLGAENHNRAHLF
jgi:hypothetical protein